MSEELMNLSNLASLLRIPYCKLKDQQYSNKRFPRAAVVTNKARGIGTLYRRQEMIDFVDSIGLREQKGLYIHLAIQFVGLKTEYAHLCYKLGYIPQPVLRRVL